MKKHLKTKLGVGALITRKGEVLLTKKKYGRSRGKWTFPEGFVCGGETPLEGLKRELQEELNARVNPKELVAVRYKKTSRETIIYLLFNCQLKNESRLKINSPREIKDFRFLTFSEIQKSDDVFSLVKFGLKKFSQKRNLGLTRVNFKPQEFEVDNKNFLLYI